MENFNRVDKEFTLSKGLIKVRRTSCEKVHIVVYEFKIQEDNSIKCISIALSAEEIREGGFTFIRHRLRQGLEELNNSLPVFQQESRCFRCNGEPK